MIRSPSVTSFAFTSSLLIAAILGTPASAEDAKTKRGQWPAVEAGAAQSGTAAAPAANATPSAKTGAAGQARQAPGQLSPAKQLDALSGVSRSRDGKEGTVKVPNNLRGVILKGKGAQAIQQGPKPGKLVPIKDTKQYPYTTIGLLSNGCSGTLIGKRFVLTAAYCIFNPQSKQWEQNLDFYPGINGDQRPFGGVQWKNAWVTKGFAEQGNWDLAFGLVELQADIGDQNGWMGFGHVPQIPKGPTLTGYPAGVADFTMWEATCPVKGADKSFILYNCLMKKPLEGMGGGPIWIVDQKSNSPMVIAIHGGPLKADLWGQRINEEAFYTLQAWMKNALDSGGGTDVNPDDTQGDEVDDNSGGGGDEVNPDDTQEDEDASQAPKKK